MFKYKIIDNFFENKDFQKIQEIVLNSDQFINVKNENSVSLKFNDEFKEYLIQKYKVNEEITVIITKLTLITSHQAYVPLHL